MPVFRVEFTCETQVYYVQADTADEAYEAAEWERTHEFCCPPEEWDNVSVPEASCDAQPDWVVDGGEFVAPGNEVVVPAEITGDARKAYARAYRQGMRSGLSIERLIAWVGYPTMVPGAKEGFSAALAKRQQEASDREQG